MIINKAICRFRGGAAAKKPPTGRPGVTRTNYVGWICAGLIPFSWYGVITLVVPLINGALQQDAVRFAEHCSMVLAASSAVLGAVLLVRMAIHRIITGWK